MFNLTQPQLSEILARYNDQYGGPSELNWQRVENDVINLLEHVQNTEVEPSEELTEIALRHSTRYSKHTEWDQALADVMYLYMLVPADSPSKG